MGEIVVERLLAATQALFLSGTVENSPAPATGNCHVRIAIPIQGGTQSISEIVPVGANGRWQATLDLSLYPELGALQDPCRVEPTGYQLAIDCPEDPACTCALNGKNIAPRCCPENARVTTRVDPACVVQDGMLQRTVHLDWVLDRASGTPALGYLGTIDVQIDLSGPLARPASYHAADSSTDPVVSGSAMFVVPGGGAYQWRLTLPELKNCDVTLSGTVDVPVCDCADHPPITAPLVIRDDAGKDVSDAVTNGDCVDSSLVTIRAPAGGLPVTWSDSAVPNASDPTTATVMLPAPAAAGDPPSSVSVTVTMGFKPCETVVTRTILRCSQTTPPRPNGCDSVDCQLYLAVWKIFGVLFIATFYLALTFTIEYTARAAIGEALGDLASAAGEAGGKTGWVAGPAGVATELAGKAAAIFGQYSATIARVQHVFSYIAVSAWLFAAFSLVVSLYAGAVWLYCCGRGRPCPLINNILWVLFWGGVAVALLGIFVVAPLELLFSASFAMSSPLGVFLVVALVLFLVFAALLTLIGALLQLLHRLLGCRSLEPWTWPSEGGDD